VRRVVLEREFRRVDSDDDQAVLAVALLPRLHIRDRAQAVDAAIGPEVDHHDMALELCRGQRRAVEPGADAERLERRERAFDGELELAHCILLRLGRAHRLGDPEPLSERGFEAGGLRARQAGEYARVETERNRADPDEDEDAEDLADTLARAQR